MKPFFGVEKRLFSYTVIDSVCILQGREVDSFMASMNTLPTIAVLGGDMRQLSAAKALAAQGFSVYAWGCVSETEPSFRVHICKNWKDAVDHGEVLLLPLPSTMDGVRLHCPLSGDGEDLRLDLLFEFAVGKLILGGRLSEAFVRRARERDVRCVDYFDSEILQLKNALPTAEGAIEIAMHELPVTVDGVHAAVIGYGRIGALLAQKLLSLGARVCVYARRQEALTRAALSHCDAISLGDGQALSCLARDVRVIFNTVPVCLFTEDVIATLPNGCLFIDLASAPGGIDRIAAEKRGIRSIWATALPGKYAPETAGQIIAETARLILDAEGLL